MRVVRFAGLLLSATPALARGQCPDGTPPPCRPPEPVARQAAPAAPSLHDGTWLVLPFDNVTRAAEVAWLRDASANLLYLELARWQDVRVVDDERVGDWLRQVGGGPPSLEAGLALARRHGAGRLVMGDILQVGAETRLVAKVFHTRDGQRVQTAQVAVTTTDSLLAAFAELAREMLGVAAGPVRETVIGTSSLPAYRAYLDGIRAIGMLQFDTALVRLREALAYDSTFALAHARLSAAHHLSHAGTSPEIRHHAAAAHRLGGALPPRERRLIGANLAMAEGRFEDACREAAAVVAADSLDVEAWAFLGECSYHDPAVITVDGHPRFRSSWELARVAFERVVALAPWAPLAYQHLPELYAPLRTRQGCDPAQVPVPCTLRWGGPVILDGDTLSTPALDLTGAAPPDLRIPPDVVRRSSEVLLERQLAVTTELVALTPDDERARMFHVRALLTAGQTSRAGEVAADLPGPAGRGAADVARLELLVEAALRSGNTALASRRLDEAESLTDATPEAAPLRTAIAWLRAVMGQFTRLERLPAQASPARAYLLASYRLASGVAVDGVDSIVARYREAALATAPAARRAQLDPVLGRSAELAGFVAGMSVRRDAVDTTVMMQMVRSFQAGDTAAARVHLGVLDHRLAEIPLPELRLEANTLLTLAHLRLGDSLRALEHARSFARHLPRAPLAAPFTGENPVYAGHLLARGALLAGDLASAMGEPALARAAYAHVVALWDQADPEYQPAVDRARAALGGR
jgi:TolB-like protein